MSLNAITKLLILVLVFVTAVTLVNLLTVTGFLNFNELFMGYDLKSEINLSKQDFTDKEAISFNTDGTKKVKLTYIIKNIDTPYIDVKVIGDGGFSMDLLHGEEFWTNSSTQSMELDLDKGDYKVLLNSKKSKGRITFYVKLDS